MKRHTTSCTSEYRTSFSRRTAEPASATGRSGRSGRHLFHLVNCDDLPAAFAQLERDPANERWQAFIGDYVDHLEQPAGEPMLPLVWRMSDQVAI